MPFVLRSLKPWQARDVLRLARITGRRPSEVLADDAGVFLRDLQVVEVVAADESKSLLEGLEAARRNGGVSSEHLLLALIRLLLER